MAKKKKSKTSKEKKTFRVTPEKVFRWFIFVVFFTLLVKYLSESVPEGNSSPVLGVKKQDKDLIEDVFPRLYDNLSDSQKEKIEQLSESADKVVEDLKELPRREYLKFKKQIITDIYKKLIDDD